jgi:hypothetical protein
MNETSTPQTSDAPVTTRARPLIFLGTYIGGAAVLATIFTFMSGGSASAEEAGMFFLVLAAALVYLPWGLLRGIAWIAEALSGSSPGLFDSWGTEMWPEHPALRLLMILSYASLVVLMIWGSMTKSQKTFRLVYLAFLFLLILNIGGCLVDPP